MSFIYFFLAITVFIFFKRRFNDLLNPIGLLSSLFLFTAGVSSLKLADYQSDWSLYTHFFIIVSIITVIASGMLAETLTLKKKADITHVSFYFKILARISFVIVLFVSVSYLRKIDVSFTNTLTGSDLKNEMSIKLKDISSINSYILNLFPYFALIAIFELVYDSRKNKIDILYNLSVVLIVVIFCSKVMISRGMLLVPILGALFIINSRKKFTYKVFILILISLIVFLGAFMLLRVNKGSAIYSGVKFVNSPVLASIYNYIASCFQNFEEIVKEGCRYKIFSNVGVSFYKLVGSFTADCIVQHKVAGIYNAVGWLSEFYDDLGFLGIILYPSIISFVLTILYKKSVSNFYFVLVLAVLQKPIYMAFFGNYFITTLSIMFPYIFVITICFLSLKMKKISYSIIFKYKCRK